MVHCPLCRFPVHRSCQFSPANDNGRAIIVACDDLLRQKWYFRRLAIATASLELPRRDIPNWMADVLFVYEGEITWPSGRAFVIGPDEIDEAFNNEGSFRWLSDFLRVAHQAPRYRVQSRIIPRLRLIDLSFRIDKPQIARHFGR